MTFPNTFVGAEGAPDISGAASYLQSEAVFGVKLLGRRGGDAELIRQRHQGRECQTGGVECEECLSGKTISSHLSSFDICPERVVYCRGFKSHQSLVSSVFPRRTPGQPAWVPTWKTRQTHIFGLYWEHMIARDSGLFHP